MTAPPSGGPPDDADPALFYTGLVAELYAPLRSASFAPDPYAAFVDAFGEPALELGCGDGDPLLALRARGLDVEGLDASPDMLDRCRRRADDAGIAVTLHEARIEEMDLGRRYRSIFLAGGTFNLLPDDDAALRGLVRIRAHLAPGGAALVPLFVPAALDPDELGIARCHEPGDGSVMRCTAVASTRDEEWQVQRTVLRYEHDHGDGHEVVEREWVLHWYTQERFRALAARAGLVVTTFLDDDGGPASPDADQVAALVQLADR